MVARLGLGNEPRYEPSIDLQIEIRIKTLSEVVHSTAAQSWSSQTAGGAAK